MRNKEQHGQHRHYGIAGNSLCDSDMIDPKLLGLGVGAVVVLAILKMVFDFIKTFMNAKKEAPKEIQKSLPRCSGSKEIVELLELTRKLWKIHDNYNEDGAPKWFFPGSTIKEILDTVKRIEAKK